MQGPQAAACSRDEGRSSRCGDSLLFYGEVRLKRPAADFVQHLPCTNCVDRDAQRAAGAANAAHTQDEINSLVASQ